MRIIQCHVSESIQSFEKEFKSRWNLSTYNDVNFPYLFLGVYTETDIKLIKENKSLFIIVKFTGMDIVNINALVGIPNIKIICNEPFNSKINHVGLLARNLLIPLKDYSKFTAVPLKDKIYLYMRTNNQEFKNYFKYELVENVIKYFGEEKFIIGFRQYPMEYVIDNYYSNSFINLHLNPCAGFTSCMEMAHMGRRSISNFPASFCLPYKDESDIIRLIESESTKIGTIRTDISEMANNSLHHSDDWLHTDYWK